MEHNRTQYAEIVKLHFKNSEMFADRVRTHRNFEATDSVLNK